MVALKGHEPHARLDARVMRLAEIPEWLIMHNEQEYEQAALRLIHDDPLRCDLARTLIEIDFEARTSEEQTKYATDFVDAVFWMYQNHSTMQQRNRRV